MGRKSRPVGEALTPSSAEAALLSAMLYILCNLEGTNVKGVTWERDWESVA